ncbi:ABC transporter permease [Leucobacter allii]|uniref:ABC transporter permease n=1 Tax=Leucobacter allii TaxID=2932247 RepID=UPI001FD425EC|nr:ABC transporter permease [Leucobacter allii]UOR02401.1 ABC transporter permease [Leucobacter allii]
MAAAVTSSITTRGSRGPAAPRGVRSWWGLLALPGGVALLFFFILPLGEILVRSLTDPSPENYLRAVTSEVVRSSFVTTFVVSILTVAFCILLGYPYAYVMARSRSAVAGILGFCVLVPFWLSILVRTYAWTVWLQNTGIINSFLLDVGLVNEPVQLMRNALGTVIGMTHVLLPFMVFSMYASMKRIDLGLERASRALGAGPIRTFLRVYLPLSLPGVYSGSLIVFVTSLGFYLTPAILGDAAKPLVGQLIVEQVNQALNFGMGSAIGILLLLVTLLLLALGMRFAKFEDIVGLRGDQ